jgi:hypothetical protein
LKAWIDGGLAVLLSGAGGAGSEVVAAGAAVACAGAAAAAFCDGASGTFAASLVVQLASGAITTASEEARRSRVTWLKVTRRRREGARNEEIMGLAIT